MQEILCDKPIHEMERCSGLYLYLLLLLLLLAGMYFAIQISHTAATTIKTCKPPDLFCV
jgi:hypothetical protein